MDAPGATFAARELPCQLAKGSGARHCARDARRQLTYDASNHQYMPHHSLIATTRKERRQLGRKCRDKVSRLSQGDWNPKQREFDALQLLRQSQRGRVTRLLPIKYARMAASPFGYFRGSVPVMAADLARLPRTDMLVQICGDAHVRNLGAFTGADGRLIFDINDFDETIRGPWEWDVKRMAASLVLAGREAKNNERDCKDAVLAFARRYREAMAEFAKMPAIDLARYQVFRQVHVSPVVSVLSKAERATPMHNLEKLTAYSHGNHHFRDQKPLQQHVSQDLANQVIDSLRNYQTTLLPERRHFFAQYRAVDVSFRVVGTGSVGVRDYIVLMFAGAIDDPLFMQIKEEIPSAYAPYLPHTRIPMHEGQRVVEGGRAMQVQSDVFLGWTSIEGRDFLVRQLRDHKASIEDDDLEGAGLVQYARVCGELLSKGHARSGDPCALYGYLGSSDKFDKAMVKFGVAYADQAEKDHQELVRAVRSGLLPAIALEDTELKFTPPSSRNSKTAKSKAAKKKDDAAEEKGKAKSVSGNSSKAT